MSDEHRRIAALERLVADQQELIGKQRESIDQQERLIEQQSAAISQQNLTINTLSTELLRRGKTKVLPKLPGLWMAKLGPKKPGRKRSGRENTLAFYEYMLKYKKDHGHKSMEKAIVGRIKDFYASKNRAHETKIKTVAKKLSERLRRRNQLK